ncbi:hypothetical protein Ae168Ps1_6184c [Pseudonocardia sp. Ae168_Ps1]|uniref:hypothetical protein n=1 Tax=unclassified Pseudonocardia TaxID=2619320 RepID=UPI000963BAC8|nr:MULTISPECIES: hypothetical protein [unclassified Pseudonocardia]OLL70437.1 hypothetical protein Ae168Ps1_6184c [Pseudonocardia sp. Ae168_Ps1]OLL71556.1 hypothetical protein Ae263Ps1_6044c [Pseudonocardia sp. Ae263_Ps1]
MNDPEARLADLFSLAEGQHGYAGLAQLGLHLDSPSVQRWLQLGLVELALPDVRGSGPAPGVLRVRAGARHDFPGLYATWVGLDPMPAWRRLPTATAVVSHRSAGLIYRALTTPVAAYEFTAPTAQAVPRSSPWPGAALPASTGRRRPAPGGYAAGSRSGEVVVRDARLLECEVVLVEGMWVTSPARTVADLHVDCGVGVEVLGRVCQNLLSAGWVTGRDLPGELSAAFVRRGIHHDGSGWLAEALEAAA